MSDLSAPTITSQVACGVVEHILHGDWTNIPAGKTWRHKRLLITDRINPIPNLDFLDHFPLVEELRILSYKVRDVSHLHNLRRLRELTLGRLDPKFLQLDMQALPPLRRLSSHWSPKIKNLQAQSSLEFLHLHHITKTVQLDLTAFSDLKHLDLGPGKGLSKVAFGRVTQLEYLGLVLLPQLTDVSLNEAFKNVTILDLRGTKLLPPSFFASFRGLKTVLVGEKDPTYHFEHCKPEFARFPV